MKGLFGKYTVASNKMNTDETFSLAYCIVYRAERLPKEVCVHILEYMATPANLLKKALRENAEINTEEDIVRVCSKRCEVSKEHKKIAAELYEVHRPVGLWFSQNGTPLNTPISMAVNTLIPRDIMLYMILNKMDLLKEIAEQFLTRYDRDTFHHVFYHRNRHNGNSSRRKYGEWETIKPSNTLILCPYRMRVDVLTPSLLPDIRYGKGKGAIIRRIDETTQATMRPHINLEVDLDVYLFKNIRKKYTRLGVKKLYAIWRRTWDEDLYDILGINNKKKGLKEK